MVKSLPAINPLVMYCEEEGKGKVMDMETERGEIRDGDKWRDGERKILQIG